MNTKPLAVLLLAAMALIPTSIGMTKPQVRLDCEDCPTDAVPGLGQGTQVPLNDVALSCVDDGCVGTHDVCYAGLTLAQAESAGIDCGSGSKKCHWYQTWEVKGEMTSGTGSVEFWTKCGTDDQGEDKKIVVCVADVDLPTCQDGPDEGGGELGCFYRILEDPAEALGKCIDPANPKVVFLAVAAGQEYIAAEHVVFLE